MTIHGYCQLSEFRVTPMWESGVLFQQVMESIALALFLVYIIATVSQPLRHAWLRNPWHKMTGALGAHRSPYGLFDMVHNPPLLGALKRGIRSISTAIFGVLVPLLPVTIPTSRQPQELINSFGRTGSFCPSSAQRIWHYLGILIGAEAAAKIA